MGKALVVAEKPSVGIEIANILNCNEKKDGYIEGNEYVITWAEGHLIKLKEPEEYAEKYKDWTVKDLPIIFDIENGLSVIPSTKKQFQIIEKLINREDIDYIINAGDAGREGILIQEWIYKMAGNKKPVKVLWTSSFTKKSILDALKNLKENDIFQGLYEEAQARTQLDYILGINYSRLFTLTLSSSGNTLVYGRCQAALLNLVVEREHEINSFKAETFYCIDVKYKNGIKGTLIQGKSERVKFKTKEEAELIIDQLTDNVKVAGYSEKIISKEAPLLYNLAELQKKMGTLYGYTPDVTLKIAQSLYEKKILSYPRTDSQFLSKDLFPVIQNHLNSCSFGLFKPFVEEIDKSTISQDMIYFNDLEVKDHYALIPTDNEDMERIYASLSIEEKNVFNEIIIRFISIFYPCNKYSTSKLYTENQGFPFLSKYKYELDPGYKKVLNYDYKKVTIDDEEIAEENFTSIPINIEEGEQLEIEEINIKEEQTSPPSRFTISSLIDTMQANNIGTAATRAEIIKKLLYAKLPFLKYEKKKYIPTSRGKAFISMIPEDLKSISFIEEMERGLAAVECGAMTREEFLQPYITKLKVDIEKFSEQMKISNEEEAENNSIGICPKCGNPVVDRGNAYRCQAHGESCDFLIWKKIAGKGIPIAIARQLLTKGYTSKLNGFKSKTGKSFSAQLYIKSDKTIGLQF